jgi:hypothetical protein
MFGQGNRDSIGDAWSASTVPQALLMLNSDFFDHVARSGSPLAESLRGLNNIRDVARGAFLAVLTREPKQEELDALKETLGDTRNAKPLAKGRGLVVRGHQWAKISKVSAGLSWAVGGMGARWEDLGIDGHQFGPTANIPVMKNIPQNALLPPSLSLVPAEHLNRPHQTMFALDLSCDEESTPLAVEIANATRHSNVMTLLEGKLAFYIWAKAMSQYRSAEDDEPGLLTTTARELARMNLTLNAYTQWYWKTDLHNLFHFLSLRADAHAQYEIRVYA